MSKKKIALLSNITVDLIAAKLRRQFDFYIPEGFDTWVQEAIDPSSGLYRESTDSIIILLDGTEARAWKDADEGKDRITLWKQAVMSLTGRVSAIPVFISTIDFRENRIKSFSERKFRIEMENDWYQFIQELAENKDNIYIFDIADTITDLGRNSFYSDKMWYMSSMPYSREGLSAIGAEIERMMGAAFSGRKKVIALDLDNTLWGGVIGEDGIEGIELSDHKEGQRYYDFQRQLLEMKKRGILLAVNSKNNPEDAEETIQKHPAMLLRDEDFVSKKINWENKALNLKSIESDLNITEGGFVFVDDNPVERETVKGECPDALVPDFPDDTTTLLSFAENLWFDYCRPLKVLGEDLKKTQMYQSEAKRKQELNTSLNLDDYIAKLEIAADIHRMRPDEIERVTQLCNKTNQFNVTTKRYTQAEIAELASDPGNAVYVVYSSDKYGDSGLISVIILIGEDTDIRIDTFLMSCRVMGRKLEDVIINELASRKTSGKRMIGEYIPTNKNVPVKDLYDRLGFAMLSEQDGHKLYELSLTDYKKKQINTYKEILVEE